MNVNLIKAIKNGNFKMVKTSINDGADVNYRSGQLMTPLMIAIRDAKPGTPTPKVVNFLLENGANPDLQDENGWTSLMHAVNTVNEYTLDVIEAIFLAGVDLDVKDIEGKTALMIASENTRIFGTEIIVFKLIEAGARLDLQDAGGQTALMLAAAITCVGSTEETVKILIDAGADLNVLDYNGNTALMMAAAWAEINGTAETVKIIMDADGQIDIKNDDGMNAIDVAKQNGALTTVRLLENEFDRRGIIYGPPPPYPVPAFQPPPYSE